MRKTPVEKAIALLVKQLRDVDPGVARQAAHEILHYVGQSGRWAEGSEGYFTADGVDKLGAEE